MIDDAIWRLFAPGFHCSPVAHFLPRVDQEKIIFTRRQPFRLFVSGITVNIPTGSPQLLTLSFQLLEYQWRWREGKFDTLGKLGSAHRAVGQHPY